MDVACRKEISAAWLDGRWAEAGVCEGEACGWRYNVKTVLADHPFWACYVWSISHGSAVDSGSNPNKVGRLALSAFQTCKAQGRSPDEVRGGEAFSYVLQVANAIGCMGRTRRACSTKHHSFPQLSRIPSRCHPTSLRRIPLGVVPRAAFIRRPCQHAISPARRLICLPGNTEPAMPPTAS